MELGCVLLRCCDAAEPALDFVANAKVPRSLCVSAATVNHNACCYYDVELWHSPDLNGTTGVTGVVSVQVTFRQLVWSLQCRMWLPFRKYNKYYQQLHLFDPE